MTSMTIGLPFAVALAGAVGLFFLHRDFGTDRFRNELFALRDEVFDYAVAEGLTENDAYRQLRAFFNSIIRFAHHINFARWVTSRFLLRWLPPQDRPRVIEKWYAQTETLPEPQKAALRAYHERLLWLMADHLFTSPLMWVFAAAWIVRALLRRVRLGRILSNAPLEYIEAQAVRHAPA